MISLQDADGERIVGDDVGFGDCRDDDDLDAEAMLDAEVDLIIDIDGGAGVEVDLAGDVGADADANVDVDAICTTRTGVDADDAAEVAADAVGPGWIRPGKRKVPSAFMLYRKQPKANSMESGRS